MQVLIMLAIGVMAAAASFTHVHNVAAAHGQSGWLAWADAVVLELMSIATGLEIRRRHRAGRPAGFVLVVLVAAVVLSLSAQVVEAERSVIGWLAAALPALGFLALIKIVLSRTPIEPVRTATDLSGTGSVLDGTAADPAVPTTDPAAIAPGPVLVPGPVADPGDVNGRDGEQAEAADLLDHARRIAAAYLVEHGRPITRDQLRAQLRVSTDTATVLHRQLKQDGRPGLVPVPAAAFARTDLEVSR